MNNLSVSIRIFCLVLLLFGSFSVSATSEKINNGFYKQKIKDRVMLQKRNYLIYIPNTEKSLDSLPVFIVLHGAFSNSREMSEITGFNTLAEKEKIIVIYPNGAYGIFGYFQHWNAGHCCGKAQKDNTDDVGFILKVLADVKVKYGVSSKKLFMVGFSNGGMLTYRFAAEHAELISGAAVVSGSIGGRASEIVSHWRIPQPKALVPMIIIHGIEDNSVPYSGGRKGKREYDSVSTSVDFWVKNNQCSVEPEEEYLVDGKVKKQIWSNAQNLKMVVLYSINDWDHYWPTDNPDSKNFIPNFNAAKIIVDYFKNIFQR